MAVSVEDLKQIMKGGSRLFFLQALRKLHGFCQLALNYNGVGVTSLLNATYVN